MGDKSVDPLSVVGTIEESSVKFDLDDLLGKDFDLDMPPAARGGKSPEGKSEQGGEDATEEASSAEPPRPGKAQGSPDPFGLGSDYASSPAGAGESEPGEGAGSPEAPRESSKTPEEPQPVEEQAQREVPAAGDAEAQAATDIFGGSEVEEVSPPAESALAASDSFGSGGAPTSAEPEGEVPSESQPDLSDSLFGDMDFADGASKDSDDASLDSLVHDPSEDKSSLPSEEEVDAALSAFADAIAPGEEPGAAEGAVADQGESSVEMDVDLGSDASTSTREGAADVSAEAASRDGDEQVEKGAPAAHPSAAESTWGEPAIDPGSREGEADWSLEGQDAAVVGGEQESPTKAATGVAQEPGPVPSEAPGSAGDASVDALDLGDHPGITLDDGEPDAPKAAEDGPPGLDLDNLPPLDLDDAPSVQLGGGSPKSADPEAEGPEGVQSFDSDADPFADFGDTEEEEAPRPDAPADPSSLFGTSLDEASGETEEGGPEKQEAKPAGKPSAKIAVGPKEQEPESPSKMSSEPKERSSLPRRLPVMAIVTNLFFAVALVAAGVGSFVVYRTGGPLDASVLSRERIEQAFASKTDEGSVVRVVSTGVYPTRSGSDLLFIRGEIFNSLDEETDSHRDELVGRVLDPDGNVVRVGTVIVGDSPTPEELWNVSGSADLSALVSRAKGAAPETLAPGESVEFLVVFDQRPADLDSLRFEASFSERLAARGRGGATEEAEAER